MTREDKNEAHIVAVELILRAVLPMLLNRGEVETLTRMLNEGFASVEPPEEEGPAAIWAKARELVAGHMEQIAAQAVE